MATRNALSLKTEDIIVIAVVVLLVLGFVLIFTGMKTSLGGGKERQSEEIKQDILQNLETVEKNLKDVSELLGQNSNS